MMMMAMMMGLGLLLDLLSSKKKGIKSQKKSRRRLAQGKALPQVPDPFLQLFNACSVFVNNLA